MQAVAIRVPLVAVLWPANGKLAIMRDLFLMIAGTALVTLSAKINVPFIPVPLSMQTFAVLVIGAAYGSRLGASTMLLYLAEGAAGLPVFAGTPEKGIGLPYMIGPTGGYLVGFVVAAFVTGWLSEHGGDRSFIRLVSVMFIGHVVIFFFGVAYLAFLIGFERAWSVGVAPFYLATVLKTVLAATFIKGAWALTSPND